MRHVPRRLDLDLPPGQSAFLWGPRKTGKTTLLRGSFPRSVVYDFLETDLFLEFSGRPSLLREQLLARPKPELAHPVILDEIQKIPHLLDEVHWLIENRGLKFILCGSSARKIRRGHANLLGGRAWRFELHPLVSVEIGEVDLLKALNRGLVPSHYLQDGYRKSLKAYVGDYLKEEVFEEGLTRNVPAFSRFFEAMAYGHGELTNFANIARECGVTAKTVKEYYQILVDTLIGRWVEPFKRRQDRQVIGRAAKFFLFDVGVAGALTGRHLSKPRGEAFGRALEHFVLMELAAHASYEDLDYSIRFWRAKSGLEVDFVLGDGEVAIEVKGTSRVEGRDVRGLRRFVGEYAPRRAIVVSTERTRRVAGPIHFVPWEEFLDDLWSGEVIR